MKPIVVALVVLTALGCSRNEGAAVEGSSRDMSAAQAPADNTKRNERDQRGAEPTPMDQAENEADRTITQQIRQQVVNGDAISTDGKNVKIITVDGVVTLRGPVQTEQERSQIVSVAKRVDGVKRVDNLLEIAAK